MLAENWTVSEDRCVGGRFPQRDAIGDGAAPQRNPRNGMVREVSDERVAFRAGCVMTPFFALSVGALTAWIVERGQRQCEKWCHERDRNV
jgi:hypothetical protein